MTCFSSLISIFQFSNFSILQIFVPLYGNSILMSHFNIAIVESNILASLGLQSIISDLMPVAEVHIFISFDELQQIDQGQFIHYFVSSRLYFEHAAYFREKARRTIVLVNGDLQISGVPTLNVRQTEKALIKALLSIHRQGHPNAHVPTSSIQSISAPVALSAREIEVAILLAKGHINKEIADLLHISLTTVITHRKNIMDKLHARSLADIILYVVMNGLVDVGEL